MADAKEAATISSELKSPRNKSGNDEVILSQATIWEEHKKILKLY